MQRLFSIAILLITLNAFSFAQSRGFIPPLFVLPAEGEEIRFTSAVPPVFQLPDYPAEQLKKAMEGVVEVRMYVTAEGEVVFSEITVSSGHKEFDNAALASAMRARFPAGYATVNGLPRDFRTSMPFYFLLSTDPEQYWQSRLELARVHQRYEIVMKRFQDYMMQRSKVPRATVMEIQQQMEETVSIAKNIHRILAEKKETAILRLRERLDEQRGGIAITATDDATWRRSLHSDEEGAHVEVSLPGSGIVNARTMSADDIERLTQELEIKKSYM
ncbi:MAG: energy transducer TonB [Bacteroidetes bacterium]|nr:energy transducer TonB [Bacteroidota bacterium]